MSWQLKAKIAGVMAGSALFLWGNIPFAWSQTGNWQDGLRQMAHLQSLIEYYYMESGVYPVNLEAIDKGYNGMVKEASMKVEIPIDPVTSKPFVYEVDNSRQTYTLSLPDPVSYGGHAITLTPVRWGWLSIAANQRRVERLTMECTHNIEILATRAEMYAKDHEGHFPPNLQALKPRYMPRIFTCPSMGMDYVYALQPEKGYTIACPNPQSHGLQHFIYNSEKGVDMKPVDTKTATTPASLPEGELNNLNNKATAEPAKKSAVPNFDNIKAVPGTTSKSEVAKPAPKSATKSEAKPADKSAVKPAPKAAEKREANPVAKPAEVPAPKPNTKPATKPAVKAADASATKPAVKPAAKPAFVAPKFDPKINVRFDSGDASRAEQEKSAVKPEVKPAPKAETKPAPKPEAKPAVKPEVKPAPKAETKPAPKLEAKPAVKPEVKPAPKAEAKPAPKPEAKPAVKPEVKPAPKAEAKPAPKLEAKPAAKPEVKPAPKAEAKPAPKLEAKPAVKPEVKPAPKAEAKPAPKPEAKPAIKPEAKPESKPEVRPFDDVNSNTGEAGQLYNVKTERPFDDIDSHSFPNLSPSGLPKMPFSDVYTDLVLPHTVELK